MTWIPWPAVPVEVVLPLFFIGTFGYMAVIFSYLPIQDIRKNGFDRIHILSLCLSVFFAIFTLYMVDVFVHSGVLNGL